MIKQKPEVHPLANADIDHQLGWLQSNYCSEATQHKFLDAVEEAKLKITNNPETWSKHWEVEESAKCRSRVSG